MHPTRIFFKIVNRRGLARSPSYPTAVRSVQTVSIGRAPGSRVPLERLSLGQVEAHPMSGVAQAIPEVQAAVG
jgi:hypothetical protein